MKVFAFKDDAINVCNTRDVSSSSSSLEKCTAIGRTPKERRKGRCRQLR